MSERILPTQEEVAAYQRRRAEEAEHDTGLHVMGGPPLPTPNWVIDSWKSAAEKRLNDENPGN